MAVLTPDDPAPDPRTCSPYFTTDVLFASWWQRWTPEERRAFVEENAASFGIRPAGPVNYGVDLVPVFLGPDEARPVRGLQGTQERRPDPPALTDPGAPGESDLDLGKPGLVSLPLPEFMTDAARRLLLLLLGAAALLLLLETTKRRR